MGEAGEVGGCREEEEEEELKCNKKILKILQHFGNINFRSILETFFVLILLQSLSQAFKTTFNNKKTANADQTYRLTV